LAGCDVTSYMRDLLNQNGHSFTTAQDLDTVRDIKEKTAFVDCNQMQEPEVTYEMPDGRKIVIERERC